MNMFSDRNWLWWAAGAVVCAALWQWVYVPVGDALDRARTRVEAAEVRLAELEQLRDEYEQAVQVGSDRGQKARRSPGFTLFAFLEPLAGRDGLKENIEFLRPSERQVGEGVREEIVEMRIADVGLETLVPYLYHVETAPERVGVKRMTIRAQKRKERLLTVDVVFSALKEE
ncbi:MAG TPA: type II secretion system protein GspM [Desulfomicrobiaceae bacterium]|nr:type II secretion system protein GspM [Desulfomicrobiaceae bacterium]